MISRNAIYNRIATTLNTTYTALTVTGRSIQVPETYPTVYIHQVNSSFLDNGLDLTNTQETETVEFEAKVFTKGNTALNSAYTYTNAVTGAFKGIGFQKVSSVEVQTNETATITTRYRRVICGGDTI